MLLKSLVMLTFLAAHGLPASHHPPDHHKHIAHRALDAELDALSQDLEEADEEADEFKRLMEGELEREMGDLESELQTCYKIAGDLATCDFKKTETTCNARSCTKLDALSFEEDDEDTRAAKVKQWTTHYLDKKTNECNEQPKPLVYFGCCRCHVDENKADHFNVKGCEGKCNVDEKAFQLFSDGTMKIHDCTASSPAAEWKEFETTTEEGPDTLSAGDEGQGRLLRKGDVRRQRHQDHQGNARQEDDRAEARQQAHDWMLPRVRSHQSRCPPWARRSHATPSRRSQHSDLGDVQVVRLVGIREDLQ